MIDWPAFLDQHRIAYKTGGVNIETHCPFCGPADAGMHMSISTGGRGWKCWRKPTEHKGRSPVRLMVALTGMSYTRASELAGVPVVPDDFVAALHRRLHPAPEPVSIDLVMPPEFLPLDGSVKARPFVNYLRYGRRITEPLVIAKMFDLRYCISGRFSGRIIFPVTYQRRLVGWTGRSIVEDDPLRYRASVTRITDHLLWYDEAEAAARAGATTIYLVEGPFDALKVWALGRPLGIVATCIFGNNPSANQHRHLRALLPRFRKRYLLLDMDMMAASLRLHLGNDLGLQVRWLPPRVKDPDELDDAGFLCD